MIASIARALTHEHMVIAWAIFLVSYFVFAVGRLPGTKIDRPAMAVIGAVLMFVFRVLAPAQAIASIDFATLETRQVPVPGEAAFVIVHSEVPRLLSRTAYAERRSECERAAQILGRPLGIAPRTWTP